MSWRDRLAAWLTKALPAPPASAVISPGQPHWSQWDYRAFASEGYGGNPWIYRSFRGILTAIAGIEVTAQRITGDDVDYLEPGHPLARLIESPTSLYGWSGWVERMVGCYLLGGQAHALAVAPTSGAGAGMPLQLIPVPPNHMHPIPGEQLGQLLGWAYNPKGSPIRIEPEDVFWWWSWNPLDDWDGLPALAPASKSIDTNNEALSYNCSLLQNGGFPGVLLKTASNVSEAQARELLRAFNLEHGSGSRGGKAKIIGGALEAITAGLTPTDGALSQTSEDTAIAICAALGYPAQLAGIGDTTYANYAAARKALYIETVLPILDSLCSALTRYARMVYRDSQLAVGYDRDTIEALQEDQNGVWTRTSSSDWLTVDEKREMTGYDPIGGEQGAVILVPGGKVPLEAVALGPMPEETPQEEAQEPPQSTQDEEQAEDTTE